VIRADLSCMTVGFGKLSGDFEDHENKKSGGPDLSFTGYDKKVDV